jgi:hypothetical protein
VHNGSSSLLLRRRACQIKYTAAVPIFLVVCFGEQGGEQGSGARFFFGCAAAAGPCFLLRAAVHHWCGGRAVEYVSVSFLRGYYDSSSLFDLTVDNCWYAIVSPCVRRSPFSSAVGFSWAIPVRHPVVVDIIACQILDTASSNAFSGVRAMVTDEPGRPRHCSGSGANGGVKAVSTRFGGSSHGEAKIEGNPNSTCRAVSFVCQAHRMWCRASSSIKF